jgi:hypothetical protein
MSLVTVNDKKELAFQKIMERYNQEASTPSDINEHLPTLFRYGQQIDSVCELGVRVVVSTWAFLAAKVKKVIGVDIMWHPNVLDCYKLSIDAGLVFEYVLGNDLEYDMPEVDALMVDSLHTYSQCSAELNRFGNKARKLIFFHDTESYSIYGENAYPEVFHTGMNCGRGIWPAIEEFMAANPHWVIAERFTNNNGLTILKRI